MKSHRGLAGENKGSEADTEVGVGLRISICMEMVDREGERKENGGEKGMLLWLYRGADILISGLMARVHKIRG